ncbi:MAG: hypothetical protein H6712_19840 [Myxococcales bacterium]|nr:hypothetical protein [Myxococcales bacterium]MCB9716128.1 hypothetical protein [Myxococcales bacterium]
MGARGWWWLGALGLGTWLGCGAGVFLCQDDGSCEQGGSQGVCQPSGYCSFPDASCESGQRYGELAGGTLAGTCVEPEELATGEVSGPGSGPGPAMTSDGDTVDPSVDEGTTTRGTSPPLDTGPEPTTDGPPGTDEGTTGGVARQCSYDEFDDESIDGLWCVNVPSGVSVAEHSDLLWFYFLPDEWPPGSHTGEIHSCSPFPLRGAELTVHIDHMPEVSSFTEGFLELGNDEFRLGMGVVGGQLYAFTFLDGDYAGTAWQPFEPGTHHYWRLRGDEDGLVAEFSPDHNAWVHLYSLPRDLSGQSGSGFLGVYSDSVPLGRDDAAYDSLELCTLEEP